MARKIVIKCPHCGQEYSISEIFYGDELIGNQHNILKDDKGKIFYYEGEEPCLEQTYQCDKCDTTFKVHATISFTVEEEHKDSRYNFDDDNTYSIRIN